MRVQSPLLVFLSVRFVTCQSFKLLVNLEIAAKEDRYSIEVNGMGEGTKRRERACIRDMKAELHPD